MLRFVLHFAIQSLTNLGGYLWKRPKPVGWLPFLEAGMGQGHILPLFFFFYQPAWRRSAFTNSSKISALEMSQPKRQTRNQQQHLFLERTAVRSKCQQAKLRVRNHTQVDSSSKESFY